MLRRLRSPEDLDLGDELILDASSRVSFPGMLLTYTNCLRSLLLQLFLEIGEHLEKLIFNGAPCFRLINPYLEHGSWGRKLFVDFFDMSERRGGWTAPVPLAATNLPLVVVAMVALEVLFLEGAIFDIDEAF